MSDNEIAEWARFFIDGKKEIERLKLSIKVRDGSNMHLYKRVRSFASRLKMVEKENALLLEKLARVNRGHHLINVIYATMDEGDEQGEEMLDKIWMLIEEDAKSASEKIIERKLPSCYDKTADICTKGHDYCHGFLPCGLHEDCEYHPVNPFPWLDKEK